MNDSNGAYGTSSVIDFPAVGDEACNIPPVADAGNDFKQCESSVHLDGSGSSDTDGTIESYLWEAYLSNSWVTIGTSAIVDYDFGAPGTYQVRLTVTDDDGASDDANLFVTVDESLCNQIPEFGFLAAGIAFVGAMGVVLLVRKRSE